MMKTLQRLLPAIGLTLFASALYAHDGYKHKSASFEVSPNDERLTMPNLPVTDRFGVERGFRDSLPASETVILSFTYTSCETLCDISNAVLQVVYRQLAKQADRDGTIVTVGIDPVRDTVQAMLSSAENLDASADWLWLAGGPRGTRPLLEALRFPAGALDAHEPMFLVGRPCNTRFTRVVGLADPTALLDLIEAQPPCGS